jgi:flagellar basal-body rod modification protein FlgD
MEITGSFTQENLDYLESIKNDDKNNKLIKNQEMGQDAFLKLLMAEMQNQDPMDPMDSKDTVAQMAQFSTVEQLTKVSEAVVKGNSEAKESILKIEQAILKLNSNLVDSGALNNTKLDVINESQQELINQMIKQNNSLSAYETESTSDESVEASENVGETDTQTTEAVTDTTNNQNVEEVSETEDTTAEESSQ